MGIAMPRRSLERETKYFTIESKLSGKRYRVPAKSMFQAKKFINEMEVRNVEDEKKDVHGKNGKR